MDEFEGKMRADVRIENIIQGFDAKRSIFWGTGTVTVFLLLPTVLRIRNVYLGSELFPSRIRIYSIPDLRIKEFKLF
jgi:hypothetical protein